MTNKQEKENVINTEQKKVLKKLSWMKKQEKMIYWERGFIGNGKVLVFLSFSRMSVLLLFTVSSQLDGIFSPMYCVR